MNIRIMKKIVLFLILLGTANACYYDVEEELYPTLECETQDVTYTSTILPILQNNCYSCHNQAANNGNVTLEGHSNLLRYVNNGQLLGAIRHESGFSPMPQNAAQLVECDIAKIEAWIDAGAPNN